MIGLASGRGTEGSEETSSVLSLASLTSAARPQSSLPCAFAPCPADKIIIINNCSDIRFLSSEKDGVVTILEIGLRMTLLPRRW